MNREEYRLLTLQLQAVMEGSEVPLSQLANASALLWMTLPDLNWAGFYLMTEKGELVLGPFQGKPACTRIQMGKGVCGTAALTRITQRVPDVHLFPGHIACDSASRSELVVPLIRRNQLIGVMDLDSPLPDRFSAEDQEGLEGFAAALMETDAWDHGLMG